MQLYVVLDRVAQESTPVFEAKNDAVAARLFNQFIEKSQLRFDEHALYCVGVISHDGIPTAVSCELGGSTEPARRIEVNAELALGVERG